MTPALPAAVDTLVIGGGISGLTAAFWLRRHGVDAHLLEACDRVGGVITTHVADGWLFEHGPNSVMGGTPPFDALIDAVGLRARCLEAAPAAKKRYVVRAGRPTALPSSPASLFGPGILSLGGLLRAMGEPFVPKAPAGREETVADFVRRRLGREVLDYMVGPFVSGVYAGDPEKMSIRHAIPRIHTLETEHGGLVRGALARRKGPVPSRKIISFPNGLQELPAAVGRELGQSLHTNAPVTALERTHAGFLAVVAGTDGAPTSRVAARRVLVALSGPRSAALLRGLPGAHAEADMLAQVPFAAVTVLGLGYRRAAVGHPLDGFGVLWPRVEKARLLGCLFGSSLFPHRAPEGHVAVTAFIGGACDPAAAALPDDALRAVLRAELHPLLAISEEPVRVEITRWPEGIPQYNLGHQRFLDAAGALEARHPGLHFFGNWRGGVSVGDCVKTGTDLAETLRAG